MPLTTIRGTFHLVGTNKKGGSYGFEPDGDSIQFKPDKPSLLKDLEQNGHGYRATGRSLLAGIVIAAGRTALVIALGGLLPACAGRLEVATPSTQAYDTYGKPGDYAWAFVAYKVGPTWVGPSDASYQNIQVRLGGRTATLVDVAAGRSTQYSGLEVRAALFRIPDLEPGKYPLEVLKNGSPVQAASVYTVTVIPD